jgi:hypothetical protein
MPPKDHQYEVPIQMRHPIIVENRADRDDIKTTYNPNKLPTTPNNYVQINPSKPDGLVMPPKDK